MEKKSVVVKLIGGFGNQLFQISFANYLRNKYQFEVKLDTSHYLRQQELNSKVSIRELIFPPSFYGFEQVSKKQHMLINSFNNVKTKNYFPIRFHPVKPINDPNQVSKSKLKLFLFSGYWQNIKYIESNKKFLLDCFKKNEIVLNTNSKKGSTLLHIRRTDYLNINENLNSSFYKNAIEYCKNNVENFNYEIFTDDKEWVLENNLFKEAIKVNYSKDTRIDTINTFKDMFRFENYIVGNSTFSLIPAILNKTSENISLIASPWFRNSVKNLNFDNTWIKIDNE